MGKKVYLVTGATGFTGKDTVDELLKNGHHVWAFVHTEDSRSEELRKKGVEIRVGEEVTGRPPMGVEEFVNKHRQAFN